MISREEKQLRILINLATSKYTTKNFYNFLSKNYKELFRKEKGALKTQLSEIAGNNCYSYIKELISIGVIIKFNSKYNENSRMEFYIIDSKRIEEELMNNKLYNKIYNYINPSL